MKKITAVLLAAWLCAALSACSSVGLNTKTLMSPPKTNPDQQEIHRILRGDAQDITFIYPRSGEYRSAIIMKDLNGDGRNDAIGFYALEDGGVGVHFLEKDSEGWRSAASFKNSALQVDRVCFGDLDGDGREDILIGWGSTAGTTGRTASVNAYMFTGGQVEEYPMGVYGEMGLTDFDLDGVYEVFTVDKYVAAEEEGEDSTPARAVVYGWKDGAMKALYAADADNSISGYSSISFGKLNLSLWGVALDGVKADGSFTTQFFYMDRGGLVSGPPGVNTEEYVNSFSRPSAAPVLCRDINGDGIIEAPTVSLLPGVSQGGQADSTSYLVDWSVFQRGGSRRWKLSAMMNLTENYWFTLPYGMTGQLTAKNDAEKRTVVYSRVTVSEDGTALSGSPLFAVRAFTHSAWDSFGKAGYEQLAAQTDTVYGIQIYTSDSEMLPYVEQIKESFRLLNE